MKLMKKYKDRFITDTNIMKLKQKMRIGIIGLKLKTQNLKYFIKLPDQLSSLY